MYYYDLDYKPRHQRMAEKEQEILDAIKVFQDKNGFPPSVRELRKIVQLGSTSTTLEYLRRLQKKQLIDWEPKTPRTIKIIAQ